MREQQLPSRCVQLLPDTQKRALFIQSHTHTNTQKCSLSHTIPCISTLFDTGPTHLNYRFYGIRNQLYIYLDCLLISVLWLYKLIKKLTCSEGQEKDEFRFCETADMVPHWRFQGRVPLLPYRHQATRTQKHLVGARVEAKAALVTNVR